MDERSVRQFPSRLSGEERKRASRKTDDNMPEKKSGEDGTRAIKEVISQGAHHPEKSYQDALVAALTEAANDDVELLVPVNEEIQRKGGLALIIMKDENGDHYIPAFTSEEEMEKLNVKAYCKLSVDSLVKHILEKREPNGLLIDPYGNACCMNKDLLWCVFAKREPKENDHIFYTKMIRKAVSWAMEFYMPRETVDDGDFSYPPLEMLAILNDMNMAHLYPDNMIAGILYDITEDTDATMDMVFRQFGGDIVSLISMHLKHRELDWEARSVQFIAELKDADICIKTLTLAKTVAEQRKLLRNVRIRGEQAWNNQVASKEMLSRYYSKVQDELYDLQFYSPLSEKYWEMVNTYKDLFVDFYYDKENLRMFQVAAGETYVTGRYDLRANMWEGPVPENAVPVSRHYTERIEDNWGEAYDIEQQAEGFNFEDYFIAVKCHMRGVLRSLQESDLDKFIIARIDYVRARYDHDIEKVVSGEINKDVYLTESPAITANHLERLAESTSRSDA